MVMTTSTLCQSAHKGSLSTTNITRKFYAFATFKVAANQLTKMNCLFSILHT
jgi:hypothetical protein